MQAVSKHLQVLERLGHEVVFPPEQTCCGQMHLNSGYHDEGVRLARRFAEVFAGYEAIARDPIRVGYRGFDVYTNPPPSAGGILIASVLAQLDREPAHGSGPGEHVAHALRHAEPVGGRAQIQTRLAGEVADRRGGLIVAGVQPVGERITAGGDRRARAARLLRTA